MYELQYSGAAVPGQYCEICLLLGSFYRRFPGGRSYFSRAIMKSDFPPNPLQIRVGRTSARKKIGPTHFREFLFKMTPNGGILTSACGREKSQIFQISENSRKLQIVSGDFFFEQNFFDEKKLKKYFFIKNQIYTQISETYPKMSF